MSDRPLPDEYAGMASLREVLWPVIGHDLPDPVDRRLVAIFEVVGERETWSQETQRRMGFPWYVFAGLEAAYYHRDRVESIEREIVETIRANLPTVKHGSTSWTRTPRISYEWIAYLNASRRTLEYLARAVSECFDGSTDKIKKLANVVSNADPSSGLAADVVTACGAITDRFAHLLASTKGESLRDQAAHKRPVEPTVLVVVFHEGKIGVELHDNAVGQLARVRSVDLDQLTLDHEPRLTKVLDTQLADLVDFCAELLNLAARAEAHRIANG